jgi:hypothetical protein
VTGLETVVRERSDPAGVAWLDESVAAVAADPTAVRSLFAAAGRKVGRGPLHPDDEPGDLFTWTVDDAARVVLLAAMGRAAADEIPALYRHGDAAERRGVLRALAVVPVGDAGLPIVEDALRTNDLRLVAAAMGPYALGRLDDAALAQAVLKCVFMGIPVGRIDGLDRRATPDMARMLAGFVHERIAAGRDIPGDVWPLIDRHPPPESIAAIEAEVDSTVPERRNAALAALALRPTPSP